jgi:hypothetical protein
MGIFSSRITDLAFGEISLPLGEVTGYGSDIPAAFKGRMQLILTIPALRLKLQYHGYKRPEIEVETGNHYVKTRSGKKYIKSDIKNGVVRCFVAQG